MKPIQLAMTGLGGAAAAAVLAAAAAWAPRASSATIRDLEVDKHRGRYELVANAFLDASPRSIYAVLTDYEDNAFRRISSVYKESDYLEPAQDGTPIVYTRMEGCLMWYCVSMRRVERLESREPYFIRTVTLPEQSDFTHSVSEWILEPVDGGTRMTYRLEMEPDFWVPPVIGPWYLKRTLSTGGIRAVNRIERLAREIDALQQSITETAAAPDASAGGQR
ncbi:MAG TPA: SRPBCC family protein [Gammaproteobacteria bacterium]